MLAERVRYNVKSVATQKSLPKYSLADSKHVIFYRYFDLDNLHDRSVLFV